MQSYEERITAQATREKGSPLVKKTWGHNSGHNCPVCNNRVEGTHFEYGQLISSDTCEHARMWDDNRQEVWY